MSRTTPYAATGDVWDRLAQCEAGGRWNTNTGNGYYGGLQEDMSFWSHYAPHRFSLDGKHDMGLVAPRPDLASRDDQVRAAIAARDSGRGYGPWPACSRRLGLR